MDRGTLLGTRRTPYRTRTTKNLIDVEEIKKKKKNYTRKIRLRIIEIIQDYWDYLFFNQKD